VEQIDSENEDPTPTDGLENIQDFTEIIAVEIIGLKDYAVKRSIKPNSIIFNNNISTPDVEVVIDSAPMKPKDEVTQNAKRPAVDDTSESRWATQTAANAPHVTKPRSKSNPKGLYRPNSTRPAT
jgi:hypothetical protein